MTGKNWNMGWFRQKGVKLRDSLAYTQRNELMTGLWIGIALKNIIWVNYANYVVSLLYDDQHLSLVWAEWLGRWLFQARGKWSLVDGNSWILNKTRQQNMLFFLVLFYFSFDCSQIPSKSF